MKCHDEHVHGAAHDAEFPPHASAWPELTDPADAVTRRRFLQLMGASLALAGVTGCSDRPDDQIVPYVDPPGQVVPGKPLYFATAMPVAGYARGGLLVESREGRPIKVEGNPDHPANLGGTDAILQASVLGLYDPDRSRLPAKVGNASAWSTFTNELRPRLDAHRASGGAGLRILSGAVTSPTLAGQMGEFRKAFPNARWHLFEPTARQNTTRAARQLFGAAVNTVYHLDRAKVIVSLDGDFLVEDPASLRYARLFINGRRVRNDRPEMNRLYVVESTLSLTGSMADHRVALRPSEIESVAHALAQQLGVSDRPSLAASRPALPGTLNRWIAAAAADLRANAGACVIIPGESQSPAVHGLAHQVNRALGNLGKTVTHTDPVEPEPADGAASLAELVAEMRSGSVDTLVILGGNPVYAAPADIDFAAALERLTTSTPAAGKPAPLTVHLSLHDDETSFRCLWHLPESHYLEAWGDVRAFDGAATIVQPLIRPLYSTRSACELVDLLLGRDRTGYEIVRATWQARHKAADFEQWWADTLRKGIVEGTSLPPRDVGDAPAGAPDTAPTTGAAATGPTGDDTLDLVIRPDPSVFDGAFANNPWLQELPKPFTKLVWDNAALVAPSLADRLALTDGDVVTLSLDGRSVEAPVMILPGLPDRTVTVHLGYGRTRAGSVGSPAEDESSRFGSGHPLGDGAKNLPPSPGFSAYALRTSAAPWFATGLRLVKTGRRHTLVTTRNHHAMAALKDAAPGIGGVRARDLRPDVIVTPETPEDRREGGNRRLVRVVTLAQFTDDPGVVKRLGGEAERRPLLSLYPGWDYSKGHQWAMSIDMTACIGCNACVVACQAENNIPVVGRTEVHRQRDMHWLRIDDYFGGTSDDPQVHHQPVPCMHCENAPCEVVCPPGATTHSVEGLNQMVYNRCVGTRYCSNNCPYKVRRFNFFNYGPNATLGPEKMQRNPEVTVRTRGVMEKCTYCVQRLNRTRIEIEKSRVERSERARAAASDEERDRLRRDGDDFELRTLETLRTACAQACPTAAIAFGDVNYPGTTIRKLKDQPHDYGLLTELTTRPRTTYLARVRNPNPAIAPAAQGGVA
jgi:molybdopterin-containing oxidoreductase family iron-sulfur binding subunit